MYKSRLKLVATLLVLLSSLPNFSEAVSLDEVTAAALSSKLDSPITGFIKYFGRRPGDEVLQCDLDLNGDGITEALLAYSQSDLYADGYLWHVFYREGSYWRIAFQRTKKGGKEVANILIHPKYCFAGKTTIVGKHALLTFVPIKGETNETGQLTVWNLDDGELSSRTFSKFPNEKQRDEFVLIFGKQSMYPRRIPASEPQQK